MATYIIRGTRRALGAQGVPEPYTVLFRSVGRPAAKGFSLKLQDRFRREQQDHWQDVMIYSVYTIEEALELMPVCEEDERAKTLAKAHLASLAKPEHPRPRGFAAMTPERLREVSARGGANVPWEKRLFVRDPKAAQRAGRKGGSVPFGKRNHKPKTLDGAPQ